MPLAPLIVALVLIALILVLMVALILRLKARSSAAESPPAGTVERQEDAAAREARHQMVDELGSELIERRVELDSRRGALDGDANLLDALNRLEEQRRDGEISDEEFEAEKIRLLGG